ncbi:hypothetical protein BB560_001260 [Smittium megazygosporum]|uniref:Uncharacterized protein n=1 Tax=Smittium megazygosporum TaxID=133381 RepID=A0A2T9ZIB5_9FUNG|nr:hypothetical protein BB560_001260 [Smittium megazygosporum]
MKFIAILSGFAIASNAAVIGVKKVNTNKSLDKTTKPAVAQQSTAQNTNSDNSQNNNDDVSGKAK